jgi:beta-lysine 5,6-aminomutase beta subunit
VRVKPYGDSKDDGIVQLSFTLPVEWSDAADEAARRLVAAMGFTGVTVAEGKPIARGFSFFVVYAETNAAVEVDEAAAAIPRERTLSMDEVDALLREHFRRKVRVAGATIGTDAHTVGIDAILNMKGYKGDYGLERYAMFETYNLGAQVGVDELVRIARERDLDVILASQTVTQKGSDVLAFTALAERLEEEGLRERVLLLCGGPRVTNYLAAELGYDAGFGRGTLPSQVATFIARRLIERKFDEMKKSDAVHREVEERR